MSTALPRVIVIGGGGTGAALLHDLTQRGFSAVLLERGELTSGTTGRHHGQLHCGARYAVHDREIAGECYRESVILRKIAPEALEVNYGLFIALTDEDEAWAPTFIEACGEAGIPLREVPMGEARRMEPGLAPAARRAVLVPDGTIDAFRLPLHFLAAARMGGAVVRTFCDVVEIERAGGQVSGVRFMDHRTGLEESLPADLVVNATGAWAGKVAGMAGCTLAVTPSPGTMVAVKGRLCNMVISHLHPAHDGDIIVPQRNLSIIGSTQWITDDPDAAETPAQDVTRLTARAVDLLPAFAGATFHAAWTAVRPLAGAAASAGGGARMLSRDFLCVDHGVSDGLGGFFSVVGGKATVLRAMAEKTVDLLCEKIGVELRCRTHDVVLPHYRRYYAG